MTAQLAIEELTVRRGTRVVIDGISAVLGTGQMIGLVGPNGSGKSTLLQTIYRVLMAERGSVLLNGTDIAAMTPRHAARSIAVVAQESPSDLECTVYEAVMLGRMPHQGAFAGESEADHRAVRRALETVGIIEMAHRDWATLSGGEKQRALVARALAQDCLVLVLDEPTNHLDVHHQLALLELARTLGRTTVAALHDLNLAAQFCDQVIVIHKGRIAAMGPPHDVFVPEVLTPVFGVRVDRVDHPRTGVPQLLFSSIPERIHHDPSPRPEPDSTSPLDPLRPACHGDDGRHLADRSRVR
ncbi:ABC transporter ATP-binding protein [soil metagenome]